MEQVVYDPESGQLLTSSFMEYGMPRADTSATSRWRATRCRPKLNPLAPRERAKRARWAPCPVVINAVMDASPRSAPDFDYARYQRSRVAGHPGR